MVAFISAVPNPVIFTYPDVRLSRQRDVSVGWDTGDKAVKGRVYRSVGGAAEVAVPGAPSTAGSTTEKIALGQVVDYVLRRAADNYEFGRTTVTTKKDALAEYLTDPDRGFIFNLNVDPRVETVFVAFQSKRAAVPYVEVRRHDNGQLVDSWMGSDFRQQHARELNGFGAGFPQETLLDLRIMALKDAGGGRVALGSGANNPEVRGSVTTGSRTVSFSFDRVHVRNDGDPAGAGEFTFTFGVGDVVTRRPLGPVPTWGEGDIPAGYDRDLNRVIAVEHAPRRMWAQVVGREDDGSFGDFLGHPTGLGVGVGGGPAFDVPGSSGFEVAEGAVAWVTQHFDLEEAPDRQLPFVMSTGNFAIAFDVYGSTRVTRRRGQNHFTGLRLGRVRKRLPFHDRIDVTTKVLPVGSSRSAVRPDGVATVMLGPDASVVVRLVNPRTSTGMLFDAGGRFEESITVVNTERELYVLGVTPAGQLLARDLGSIPPEGEWMPLGDRLAGPVCAVNRGSCVDVLARDEEGNVQHLVLGRGAAHGWTRLGGPVMGPVAATTTAAGELAVFGLGPRGDIVHQRLTGDARWVPGEGKWESVCRADVGPASDAAIHVEWVSAADLVVSVTASDELVGAVLWQDFPRPEGRGEWTPVTVADSGPSPDVRADRSAGTA